MRDALEFAGLFLVVMGAILAGAGTVGASLVLALDRGRPVWAVIVFAAGTALISAAIVTLGRH